MAFIKLAARSITAEAFRPYGQLIYASAESQAYGSEDAQLQFSGGIPRLYIMRLNRRGCTFSSITRHQRCTQCLGSLHGKSWLMAVAPPSMAEQPTVGEITAFRIPGDCFIKLNVGTWHAGPYFKDDEFIDFYNLELSDTNLTDHHTCNLLDSFGIQFEMV